MTTSIKSAQDIILEDYDMDTLKDIAQHGCVTGVASGFIYYHETVEFFDAHEDEIESYIEEVFGSDYLTHFAKDVCDMTQLKNALVWCFVELVASNAIEED